MKPKKCCRNCEHLNPSNQVAQYWYSHFEYEEDKYICACKFSTDRSLNLEHRCNSFKWQDDLRKLIKK